MINYKLTPREIDVLKLFCFTQEEIAKRLNVTVATVATHRNNILQKLLSHTKSEALVVALKRNIISINDICIEGETPKKREIPLNERIDNTINSLFDLARALTEKNEIISLEDIKYE